MQLVLLCVLVLSLLQPGLLQDGGTEDTPTNDGGDLSESITELKNIVLAHSKQMVDFSQEVRGQLDTINGTVSTLQGQLESLAREVGRNHKKISQVNQRVKTIESAHAVSQNTSLQLASQLSNGLNKLREELTTNSVLAHNRIQAQLTALNVSLQRQCRQASLEALQDSLAADTRQLATATDQLSTGHQTVSSDCDNRTVELLQGQQTVVETLHSIEEKLRYLHICEGNPGWRRVSFLNMTDPNLTSYFVVQVYCNNETRRTEYRSCGDVNLLDLPSGTYTIRPSGGSPVTVYCDMDMEECGGGVWTRVASYNYSDPSTTCPGDWNLTTSPVRSCGRSSFSASCASAVFSTNNIEFSSVCGRVIAIQYGSPSAFYPYHSQSQRGIDGYYVDGVSITYGNPRQHVWTFAGYPSDDWTYSSSVCPCSQPSQSVPSPPHFVGNNYFCNTAAPTCCSAQYYPDDPLWDGQGCGGPSTCCSFNNPPWFSTALSETTSDDIEVRICDNQASSDDDTPITTLDLYIQ